MRDSRLYEEVTRVIERAQTLRQQTQLNVVKAGFTPRAGTDLGRGYLSFVMSIECEVPKDSYLFVGSGSITVVSRDFDKILNQLGQIARAIDYLLRSGMTLDENSLKQVRVGQTTLANILSGIRVLMTPVEYRGRIIIPGSSIKGAIRNRLELAFKIVNNKVDACFIRQSSGPLDVQRGWRYIYINGPEVAIYRSSTCNLTHDNEVCKVCDLLGTAGLLSRVDFSDALPTADFEPIEMELEYNEHILAIPPGTRFRTEISFRNVLPEEAGLIFMALNLHCQRPTPILIGRFKFKKKFWKQRNIRITFGRLVFLRDSVEIRIPKFVQELSRDVKLQDILRKGETSQSCTVLRNVAKEGFLNYCISRTYQVMGNVLREDFLKCSFEEFFKKLEKASEEEYHVR